MAQETSNFGEELRRTAVVEPVDALPQPRGGSTQADPRRSSPNNFVTRAFTFAVPGDTLQSLAERLLPGHEDGRSQLLAWNPHLMLRAPTMDTPGGLLPTDLVYTEPAASR